MPIAPSFLLLLEASAALLLFFGATAGWSVTSTRARATPMAGTTHFPQLHWKPCHANLPTLASHLALGHVSRPDSGASSDVLVVVWSTESGNRDGRIHVSGCKKIWAQSALRDDLDEYSSLS